MIEAVPAAEADIDVYIQHREDDGSWSDDLWAGESSSTTEEIVNTGRLAPGVYRVEVHNRARNIGSGRRRQI